MRKFLTRALAVVALVAGLGLGCAAAPAIAATPSAASAHSLTTGATHQAHPADWWF